MSMNSWRITNVIYVRGHFSDCLSLRHMFWTFMRARKITSVTFVTNVSEQDKISCLTLGKCIRDNPKSIINALFVTPIFWHQNRWKIICIKYMICKKKSIKIPMYMMIQSTLRINNNNKLYLFHLQFVPVSDILRRVPIHNSTIQM